MVCGDEVAQYWCTMRVLCDYIARMRSLYPSLLMPAAVGCQRAEPDRTTFSNEPPGLKGKIVRKYN
jgi:hypothetical protein